MKMISSQEILAKNLRALMNDNQHSENDLHKKTGMSQSTIGRVLKGEIATKIDTVDQLARVYGLNSWQILIENLDVKNPPLLQSISSKEIEFYKRIKAITKEFQQ